MTCTSQSQLELSQRQPSYTFRPSMPVHREPQREARRFRDVAGWVFPDERARSDPSTGATTSTVGTNTGVTALQQLRFLVSYLLP